MYNADDVHQQLAHTERRVETQGKQIDSLDDRLKDQKRDIEALGKELTVCGKRLDGHRESMDCMDERLGSFDVWRAEQGARMERTEEIVQDLKKDVAACSKKIDDCVVGIGAINVRMAGWQGKNSVVVALLTAVGVALLSVAAKKMFGI